MRKNCLQSADPRRSATAGFLLVGLCVASFATPTTATVQGTVTDVSGAALTNAAVALRHRDQGRTTTTSTDSQGKYRVAGLLPGGY
jgi:protocatechuate 3,4-dioxygenase beta subunit